MAFTIGFDGHVLTGRFQGTRTTVTNLLQALAPKLGKHRLIVYSDDPVAARAHLNVDGFEYESLGKVGRLRRLLTTIPCLFKRDNVDIGVFQYMSPMTGRNIVFIHDILPITHAHLFPLSVRIRTRIFFTLAIWRAAAVITVSNYTRRELEKHYNLPPSKLSVVLNGPSFAPEVYSRSNEPLAEAPYILAVGRIEPRKNIPLLIESFIMAAVPGVRLIVVGSFDLGFQYQIPEDAPIEILNSINDEALIDLFRNASLFVYPTQAEGFGIPLLDAILFGLPIISSNKTALPEVGGQLVRYFDPTDPDALGHLSRLIKGHFSETQIPRPTDAQRAEHGKQFSWDRSADAFIKVLNQLES